MQGVVLVALPLEVAQLRSVACLGLDECGDLAEVAVVLPVEDLAGEAEEAPFSKALKAGFEGDDHSTPETTPARWLTGSADGPERTGPPG